MTPEQFENTVNFILGCQARTDENLEKITKVVGTVAGQVGTLTETIVRIEKRNEETSILVQQNSEDIRELKAACRDLLDASINQSKRLSRMEDR